jgi:hypothetical protein
VTEACNNNTRAVAEVVRRVGQLSDVVAASSPEGVKNIECEVAALHRDVGQLKSVLKQIFCFEVNGCSSSITKNGEGMDCYVR